jgi:hypothetical protein
MNITQRRLYLLSFVATFFLTAPVLVFIAKGYSFDRIGGVFVHNGAITIKSNPKKVDLYLDGKKISNKMLNIINNYYVINGVRFGNHTIEARRAGYTTWKKKIDVHSGVSTEFWNILLFPTNNNSVKIHTPENINKFYLSPRQDDELVLYKEKNATNNEAEDNILEHTATAQTEKNIPSTNTEKRVEQIISLFTTTDNQENIIYTTTKYTKLFPDANENIEWSSNHKKLLIPALIDQTLPIEKKVTINSNKTLATNTSSPEKITLKDYVILDLKNKEESGLSLLDTLSTINFTKLKSTYDKNILEKSEEVIVPDDSTAKTTNQESKNDTDLLTSGAEQSTKKISISTKKDLLPNEITTEKITTPEIYQVRWMFDSDYQLLMLTKNHQLFFINIEDPAQSSLLAEDVNGFDLAGDHVYYSDLNTNSIWDIKPNRPEYQELISITELKEDSTSFIKLFAYDELRIALITSSDNFYVLNKLKSEDKTTLKFIENNVLGVQFSDDGKKILYWTDKEFWTYMLRKWDKQPKRQKGEKIFITSFASGIKNVQWMEAYENVIFTNNSLIKSAELDNREQINISNILPTKSNPKEKEYLYDKETSILYFLDFQDDTTTNPKLQSVKLLEKTGLFGLGN